MPVVELMNLEDQVELDFTRARQGVVPSAQDPTVKRRERRLSEEMNTGSRAKEVKR
jgi:type III secretory pathway component EscU